MKRFFLPLQYLIIPIFFINCGSDDICDERYVQSEDGACIPRYTPDVEELQEKENIYYHEELGYITYSNGKWHYYDGEIDLNID